LHDMRILTSSELIDVAGVLPTGGQPRTVETLIPQARRVSARTLHADNGWRPGRRPGGPAQRVSELPSSKDQRSAVVTPMRGTARSASLAAATKL
jgi:hypothetical protein